MTRKWYATLRYPNMHPHINFGIPTSKNIGDMPQTQSRMDGHSDYYIPPKVPFGHIKLFQNINKHYIHTKTQVKKRLTMQSIIFFNENHHKGKKDKERGHVKPGRTVKCCMHQLVTVSAIYSLGKKLSITLCSEKMF